MHGMLPHMLAINYTIYFCRDSTSPPRQFKKRSSRPIAGRKRNNQVMKVIDTIPEQIVVQDPQLNSNVRKHFDMYMHTCVIF